MKKLVALFITLLLFSCSTEENENNSVDPIIGVWEGQIIDTEYEEVIDVTITVSAELLKTEIRYIPMTSTSTGMATENTNDGLCTSSYEVTEFTWENMGDDFTRQQQTYALLEYLECGELYTYEDEEEKEYYTEEITFFYNSDFTEFIVRDEEGVSGDFTYYKVMD